MIGLVYLVMTPSGHVYIGKRHKSELGDYYGSGLVIQRSVKKHGCAAHSRAVVARCGTAARLNAAERRWIKFYRRKLGTRRVLNIADGGDGQTSAAATLIQARPGHRARVSASCLATYENPKVRAKISAKVKARCADVAWLRKRTKAQKRSWTPERKAAASATFKARWAVPGYREQLSATHQLRGTINNIPKVRRGHGPDGRFLSLSIGGTRVVDEDV